MKYVAKFLVLVMLFMGTVYCGGRSPSIDTQKYGGPSESPIELPITIPTPTTGNGNGIGNGTVQPDADTTCDRCITPTPVTIVDVPPVVTPPVTVDPVVVNPPVVTPPVVDPVVPPVQDCNLDVVVDTSAGNWFKGEGTIWTAWANQAVKVKVKNICKTGWYRLAVEAKNIYGPLPDFYKNFAITAIDNKTGKAVGGLSIKASDKKFHKGSMLVFIEDTEADFTFMWTNDAYNAGVYDANIEIKGVSVWYAKNQNHEAKTLKRNAFQYSEVNGRFFWDDKSVFTYWANQTITFNFPKLAAGKYEVIIVAKNIGTLPKDYKNFEVVIDADNVSGKALIHADSDKYHKGSVVLDITGGDTDVSLTWINDAYKEGVYDANIQIKSVKLKKVGESKRSALAAYLLGTKAGNRVILSCAFMLCVTGITGISLWHRKHVTA